MSVQMNGRGAWGWLFNPLFLSFELLLLNHFVLHFSATSESSLLGVASLLGFGLLYKSLDFSSQTNQQVGVLVMAAFAESVMIQTDAAFTRTHIQWFACVALVALGVLHLHTLKLVQVGEQLQIQHTFNTRVFDPATLSVEIREPGVTSLFRTGDLLFHAGDDVLRISGVYRPALLRRMLIDELGVKPHFQKASWSGTLWLFLAVIALLVLIEVGLFIALASTLPFDGVGLLVVTIIAWTLVNFIVLNLRLPRVRQDPAADLRSQEKLAEGMWTEIFHQKEGWVTKQLFRCGWGHNDYVRHRLPVLGSKICGTWNPLILVIVHAAMLVYQMVGVHRRIIHQDFVSALPATDVDPSRPFRYNQARVPSKLTAENLPEDIREQMARFHQDLAAVGLSIDDMHADNFRVDVDGTIKAIDGELYTDGEVFLKTLLVRLIDGRQVKGMQAVLGHSRIVRWVDHRAAVDDLVGLNQA